jgi:hypothetical protein
MTEFVPSEFFLSQNYPNPFREKTLIKFCIPMKTRVIITVYNSDGDLIEKLVDDVKNPGTYEVEFSAFHSRENGNPENKIYRYRLEADNYKCEKKMELIK